MIAIETPLLPLVAYLAVVPESQLNEDFNGRIAAPEDLRRAGWVREGEVRVLEDRICELQAQLRDAEARADYLDDQLVKAWREAKEVGFDQHLIGEIRTKAPAVYERLKLLWDARALMPETNGLEYTD